MIRNNDITKYEIIFCFFFFSKETKSAICLQPLFLFLFLSIDYFINSLPIRKGFFFFRIMSSILFLRILDGKSLYKVLILMQYLLSLKCKSSRTSGKCAGDAKRHDLYLTFNCAAITT